MIDRIKFSLLKQNSLFGSDVTHLYIFFINKNLLLKEKLNNLISLTG